MQKESPPYKALTHAKWIVALGFATQGLGYATVMTALPSNKSRFQLSDDQLSFIILGVCIAAASGSIFADRIAVKFSSRIAMMLGFLFEGLGIIFAAFSHSLYIMILGFVIYGVGLGCIDAALNMQAVMIEQKLSRSILGGFFACYTAAAFSGALIMSATITSSFGAILALTLAAGITLIISGLSYFGLQHHTPQNNKILAVQKPTLQIPLPLKGILSYGMIILIVFTLDSAISTWSTIYLKDTLMTSATIAPLGYAAYQMGIFVTRLSADQVLKVKTTTSWAIITSMIGVMGCMLAGLSQQLIIVILGFALVGVAVGALVPLTFSAAGQLNLQRRDEVIARINIFNYGGAILGAVVVGLLSTSIGYGFAFALLGIGLSCVFFFRQYFKHSF